MAEDLGRIRRFVDALTRRERLLLVVQVLVQVSLVLALVLVLMGMSVGRWDRSVAAAVVVFVGGIGLWFAAAWPLLRRWQAAGDRLRQARAVEAIEPGLGGRLVTSVERVDRPLRGESEAMVALVARRAAAAVEGVSPARIHPHRRVLRGVVLAVLVWLALPVASLLLPGGPGAVVRWWTAGSAAMAALAEADDLALEAEARVGDLLLRYRYPDYTGLEPKVVPNSTGDVSAPPGTLVEVTARSAEAVEAAGLEAYDARLDATISSDAREVTARFDVASEPGTYRLILYKGGEPERSRAFQIVPEEDLPPDVVVELEDDEGPLEVALDQSFGLGWRVRDDYGVKSVTLQVDGADVGVPLYRMVERRAEVFDSLSRTPRDLGLSPGDRVKLRVAAFDNDTVSGSKLGVSRPIELLVLGARGLDRRAAERQAELLKLMIPVLARHLTDPWPAGETGGEMAAWGETLGRRYEPLFAEVEEQWRGMSREQLDASVMSRVVDSGTELIRYTQVAFTPDDEGEPKEAAFEVSSDLRNDAVVALEEAILAFHRMLRNRALRDVAEVASDLASAAAQLEEMLANDSADAQEMLARLDMLERMMQQLMEEAARLDDGGLREYVNQREGELSNLMEEVRKALAEGDMEEARQLMERLAQQMEAMSQGIQEQMRSRQGEESDAQEQAQELVDELERLEQQQRQLQAETRELREQDGGEQAEKAAELWRQVEEESRKHLESSGAYAAGLKDAGRPFWEQTRAESALEMADRLLDSARARDLRGAYDALGLAEHALDAVEVALQRELQRGASGPGRAELQALRQRQVRIRKLLDQLAQASQQSSPEQRQQAQELSERQRDLENQLKQASEQAQQLQQEFPVKPQGMEEALEEAGERMEQASEDLQSGQPMQAEGSQGVASQRIQDARESMEQAMQQAQQQAQPMMQGGSGGGRGQEQGEGQEGHGEGNSGQSMSKSDLDIPTREEFTTPEAYRRALLEGMEGDVPEEFRAMKKRYYEELVHQ